MKTNADQLVTGQSARNLLSLWWALKRNRDQREQRLLPSGQTVTDMPCAGGLSLRRGAIGTAANQTQVCAAREESIAEARRIHDVDEPVASVALARVALSEDTAPSAEQRLWHALRSADHRAGELWETQSYVAIWLCGLVGIGLCFR